MEAYAAFDADVKLLPQWVQIWMDILGLVLVVSTVCLLVGKQTRAVGLYMLISTVAIVTIMVSMHAQLGMVRLLGVVHIVFWTPLVLYLWQRLKTNPPPPGRYLAAVMTVLMIVCFAALIFDYYDVTRWILGQRAPVV